MHMDMLESKTNTHNYVGWEKLWNSSNNKKILI